MQTTIFPAIKGAIFYIPFFWSGICLAQELLKLAGFGSFTELHNKLHAIMTSVVPSSILCSIFLYLAAYHIIFWTSLRSANTIRKYRRKKQFHRIQGMIQDESKAKSPNIFITIAIVFASSILCGGLMATYVYPAHWMYLKSFQFIAQYGIDVPKLPPAFRVGGAAGLLLLSIFIYGLLVSTKHGPIFKTYRIRGSLGGIKALFSLLWKKAKVNRFGINLQTEDLIGVSKQNRITELVTAIDLHSKEKNKYYLGHSEEYEPHEVQPEVTSNQVKEVIEHLELIAQKGEEPVKLNRDNYLNVARKGGLYDIVIQGELEGLKIDQVEHILRAMRQESTFDPKDSAKIANYVNNTKVFDIGGMFNELIFKDQNDSFIPFVRLRENPLQTRHVSVQEYGPQSIEDGKLLVVTSFTAFDSKSDEDSEDQGADQEAFGAERNTIRENHKPINRVIINGFGASYSFIHKDSRYVYDEWWTGSFKPLMRLFPNVHRETTPRRIGYIREVGGKIVAKIVDVNPLLKLIGTYNRDIDIYDPVLASDNNFGARLCLFSQFLMHQVTYRKNLSQQMLSLNPKYSAGDIDQSQH